MVQENEQQEELRYERKFLTKDHSHKDVEQMIKFHPACFSEIYYERQINNIYFDTLGFDYYYDNVEGETDRLKVRIRWYGELFGIIAKPVLEQKIKKGLLGIKRSYPLASFVLEKGFSRQSIVGALQTDKLPENVKNELRSLQPVLLSSYTRRYFITADKKFRLTVDHHLRYFNIRYGSNTFLNASADPYTTVVELKYDASLEHEANHVASQFPFPLTKSSKYVQGLDRIVY